MEKYLGLVRKNRYSMIGVSTSYKAMVSSNEEELKKWLDSFKDSESVEYDKVIIPNSPELEAFFELCMV